MAEMLFVVLPQISFQVLSAKGEHASSWQQLSYPGHLTRDMPAACLGGCQSPEEQLGDRGVMVAQL